jgi:superfamily I DNA and RNA helicase
LKVQYKLIFRPEYTDLDTGQTYYNTYEVEVVSVKYCCEKMEDAAEWGAINKCHKFKSGGGVGVALVAYRARDEKQIQFCPFCGEKITVECVENIKRTTNISKKKVEREEFFEEHTDVGL